ncbi:MAG TPA: FG-GAP-like repeat-containing protein, partial [Terracidiphilus sp.]
MPDISIGAPPPFASLTHRLRKPSLLLSGLVSLVCLHTAPAFAASSTVTALTLTAAGAPASSITSGTVVTMTAAVTSGATAVNSGQVNFCDASASLCTDIHLLGTAQLTSSGAAVVKLRPGPGIHDIKAVFVGAGAYAASQSALSILNVTGISTTAIAKTESSGGYTLTATVIGKGSKTPPTGSVDFLDLSNGSAVLGSAALGSGTVAQSFGQDNPYEAGVGPVSIAAGDFNGDGKPDLAIANDEDNTLTVFLGDGKGAISAQNNFPAGGVPVFVAVGDFNGDGNLDIALANQGTNTVGVLLGNGDGTFQNEAFYAAGNNPQSVAVGDFNGDGKLDLAVANNGENTVSVLRGNGDGSFQRQVAYATGSGPVFVTAADFDRD